ncbi:Cloroperoxidase, partial [Vararia minispora EC-137]
FIPPRPSDRRSPCPALNALANHGYLPRSGNHVTVPQLVKAMHAVYRVTVPLGTLLAVIGAWLCGTGWSLDLHDLAEHNKIEHDGSLTHADARPGAEYAPVKPDQDLLKQMLTLAPGSGHITLQDLIHYRVRRDATLPRPLSSFHKGIAFGEIAFTLELFGDDDGHIPKDMLEQFFAEERLPHGWTGPREPLGLLNTT